MTAVAFYHLMVLGVGWWGVICSSAVTVFASDDRTARRIGALVSILALGGILFGCIAFPSRLEHATSLPEMHLEFTRYLIGGMAILPSVMLFNERELAARLWNRIRGKRVNAGAAQQSLLRSKQAKMFLVFLELALTGIVLSHVYLQYR